MTNQYVLFRGFYSTLPIGWAEAKAIVGTEAWHHLIDGEPATLDNDAAAALKAKLPPSTLYSVEQARSVSPKLFLGDLSGPLFTHSRTCGYEVFVPPVPNVGNWAIHRVTSDVELWRNGGASFYAPLDDEGMPFDLLASSEQVDAELKAFFDDGEQTFPIIENVFRNTPLPFWEREWEGLVEKTKPMVIDSILRYWRADVVRRARQIVQLLQTEGESGFAYPDDPEVGYSRFLAALKYERAMEG
jgi:hypothetical protein